MASQYIPEVPSIPLDPSIPQFFENFYKMSDTPDAHDEYVRNFTDEATLIMASTKAVGKEGLSFHVFLIRSHKVPCFGERRKSQECPYFIVTVSVRLLLI